MLSLLSISLSFFFVLVTVSGYDVNTLGNLSPYHKAPVPPGVSETLPKDCVVNQVMLVS